MKTYPHALQGLARLINVLDQETNVSEALLVSLRAIYQYNSSIMQESIYHICEMS